MSQENVEIVRRGCEARIRGDLDALLALFDPAVVWDTTNFEGVAGGRPLPRACRRPPLLGGVLGTGIATRPERTSTSTPGASE
jgi:hypothetical protein